MECGAQLAPQYNINPAELEEPEEEPAVARKLRLRMEQLLREQGLQPQDAPRGHYSREQEQYQVSQE
jgi:hypothetical protein